MLRRLKTSPHSCPKKKKNLCKKAKEWKVLAWPSSQNIEKLTGIFMALKIKNGGSNVVLIPPNLN